MLQKWLGFSRNSTQKNLINYDLKFGHGIFVTKRKLVRYENQQLVLKITVIIFKLLKKIPTIEQNQYGSKYWYILLNTNVCIIITFRIKNAY